MLGDGEHALAGNVASAEHVFEEGNDIVVAFRSAERDNQDRVVIHGFRSEIRVVDKTAKNMRFGAKTSFERVPIREIP
jgi:hypothetical protein